MKNQPNRTHSRYLLLFLISILLSPSASADIIHQSASMGPYPQYTGYIFDEYNIVGSRFYVSEETQVTSIGGHMLRYNSSSTCFGVIIDLSSSNDMPNGFPFDGWDDVASTTFVPPYPSYDFRTPLSATLSPGWYAIVFGSGFFGSSSFGQALTPTSGQGITPGTSFIISDGLWWYNASPVPIRFVVEGTVDQPGVITGYKFNDLDNDGVKDGGEPGMPGWDIYLDLNDNGQRDSGEPNDITASNGYYEIYDINPGTHKVAEINKPGWIQTYPVANTHSITVAPNDVINNINFGNRVLAGNYIELTPIEDVYVSEAYPDTNYGNSEYLRVGENSSSSYTSYVKFDMSAIPPGQVIISARLIFDPNSLSTSGIELELYRTSNDNWDEMTTTWNGRPSKIFTSGPIIYNKQIISENYTVWDVTEDVDDEYVKDGICSFMTYSYNLSPDGIVEYWSSEASASTAPVLQIEYEPMFGGGSGDSDDPYQIWTGEQLNTIGLYPNRWRKYYMLMDNISLSAYTGSSYNVIGTSRYINTGDGPFLGFFDGNNKSISNFNPASEGIFGYCSGTIKNLNISSPVINSSGNTTGPLVSYAYFANIHDCSVIGGSIQGDNNIGGLIGYSSLSYVANCSSSASVSGDTSVGGIIGDMSAGEFSNCYATGDVSGTDSVGGFIGSSADVTITNCYSTGLVTGTTNTGGFSGYNETNFDSGDHVIGCFWDTTSSVMLTSAAGTGVDTPAMQNINTFLSAGWDFVNEVSNGGSDSWAMPAGGGYPVLWYQLPVAPPLPPFAGGNGTPANPYIIETVTQLNSIANNPRLMDKSFKLANNIDLTGKTFFPIAQQPFSFSGTFDGDNHKISNLTIEYDFNWGSVGFICNLNGTNALIKDLTLTNPNIVSPWSFDAGSLVGINNGGTISNCHAINTNIEGNTNFGGLVGSNIWYANISGCSATGNVSDAFISNILTPASTGTGGLVGANRYWSNIENSYAKCKINAKYHAGGLIGANYAYSTISNCYANGTVTSIESSVGGLIGWVSSAITAENCYSSAKVYGLEGANLGGFIGYMRSHTNDTYTQCLWDSDINYALPGIGNNTNPNVIAQTTNLMKSAATFKARGWDFVGESANGTDDLWTICETMNYPKFAAMVPAGDFLCPDGVDVEELEFLAQHWLMLDYDKFVLADIVDNDIIDIDDLLVVCNNWLNSACGDCNGADLVDDDLVDYKDFAVISSYWQKSDFTIADLNNDGDISNPDFAIFAQHWKWDFDIPADFVIPFGVDYADFVFFMNRWLDTGCAATNDCDGTDLDLSGQTDIFDLSIFAEDWLAGI